MGVEIPKPLEKSLKKPVAVFGWGVSGRAVGALLDAISVEYTIYDEREGEAFTQEKASAHDLVVYSPGFSQAHAWMKAAKASECRCMGELEFGRFIWKGEVITVTGTNGKSSLTTLLAGALGAVACGNIGKPLCACVLEDADLSIAVCEVSSFQAETLESFEASGVLWTNFAPDHLDRHGSEEHYFKAKWQLVEQTLGIVVLGASVREMAERMGVALPEGAIVIDEVVDVDLPNKVVMGRAPQRVNYAMAREYMRARGGDLGKLREAALDFKGLPHRMEFVAEIEGVRFWDDSKATNFNAALAALWGFDGPVFWIGGGQGKGCDISSFVRECYERVEEAFLIGETAEVLGKELKKCGIRVAICENLEEAVKKVFNAAKAKGDSEVLLSPGFSSFDQFENFFERGKYFKKYVLGLKRGTNVLKLS